MDSLDKKLLNLVQKAFPVVARPYAELGHSLGLEEAEVIRRLEAMKKAGILRRLGAICNTRQLGYYSTLCAIQVPPPRVEEVAALVNSYSCVTHNYLREGEYNLWFTLICPSREEAERVLAEIREQTGLAPILNLPATRLFKVEVNFDLEDMAAHA